MEYSYIYRQKAEKALGKLLHSKHPIHHHSDIQLVICENKQYHQLLHSKLFQHLH